MQFSRFLFLLALGLILLPAALGFSLLLGTTRIDFQPGLEQDYSFQIWNNDAQDHTYSFQLYVPSDAYSIPTTIAKPGDIVSLPVKSVLVKAGEQYAVPFRVKLPESIPPGIHQIGIDINQDAGGSQAEVGAQVVLTHMIKIYEKYPGKYAVVGLENVKKSVKGEPIIFSVNVKNLGSDVLDDVQAFVHVEFSGKRVKSATSGRQVYVPGELKPIEVTMETDDLDVGEYIAQGGITYSGKTTYAVDTIHFQIGEFNIAILDVSQKTLTSNQVNKFTIKLDSNWNSPIEGVYATVTLLKNGQGVASSKTETTDLGRQATTELPAFLDLSDIAVGDYTLDVTVHYADKTSQASFPVQVVYGKQIQVVREEAPPYLLYVGIGVAILILLNIIFFMVVMRKKRA